MLDNILRSLYVVEFKYFFMTTMFCLFWQVRHTLEHYVFKSSKRKYYKYVIS